jgi:hypothetical protein
MQTLRRRLFALCSMSVLGVLIAAPSAGSIASTGIFHRPRVAVATKPKSFRLGLE